MAADLREPVGNERSMTIREDIVRRTWATTEGPPALAWIQPFRPSVFPPFLLLVFDLTTAVVLYSVLVAAVFISLWLWYDRRDHRRFERERRKTTFHCIRCDTLYTAPAGTELSKCPKCGHENTRLKF